MASVAYLLGPVLVLLGSWSLLRWYEDSDRRRLAAGLGCLAAAVVVTAVGITFEHPTPPATTPSSVPEV